MQDINNITVTQLFELINANKDFQLIDTREPTEHAEFNIGGTLIPLGDIIKNLHQIDKEKKVVLYCRHGIRSQIAIQRLQQKFPFKNLVNLVGGIEEWKKHFS